MPSDTPPTPVSRVAFWVGIVLSALPVLLLVMSGVMKLMKPDFVVKSFTDMGHDEGLLIPLGIVELVCTILYVFPRTTVLGAILLTGYLGGATATHLRIGDPYYGPIVVGVLLWLGLYLREPRLRVLAPLRS